jgi:hypothetical protein
VALLAAGLLAVFAIAATGVRMNYDLGDRDLRRRLDGTGAIYSTPETPPPISNCCFSRLRKS